MSFSPTWNSDRSYTMTALIGRKPVRGHELTRIAILWGVKRRWWEPDWLLRWRAVDAIKAANRVLRERTQ
jgi:hypothetical protein